MKEDNILYNLHESDFISYEIKDNDLIFRVAVNCAITDVFDIVCDYYEKMYIFDIVCHNFKFFEEVDYDNRVLNHIEIMTFDVIDDKYILSLYDGDWYFFSFDCDSVEWIPIELVSGSELENIPKYKIE